MSWPTWILIILAVWSLGGTLFAMWFCAGMREVKDENNLDEHAEGLE